jgi:hypothetical protein
MLILSVALRVAAFALAGLFATRDLWLTVALLLPLAGAGHRWHLRAAPATLARAVGTVLLVTGGSLIVRSL